MADLRSTSIPYMFSWCKAYQKTLYEHLRCTHKLRDYRSIRSCSASVDDDSDKIFQGVLKKLERVLRDDDHEREMCTDTETSYSFGYQVPRHTVVKVCGSTRVYQDFILSFFILIAHSGLRVYVLCANPSYGRPTNVAGDSDIARV